jgi:FAD synthetase
MGERRGPAASRRVLVFGTFDLLHPGHASFLRQARRHGGMLLAAVARDTFVASFKGKSPRHGEAERKRRLLDSGLVDGAYLGDKKPGSYAIVRRLRPDVICLGHDQHLLQADLERWIERTGASLEVHRLRAYRPDIYKSSKLEAAATHDAARLSLERSRGEA